MNLTSISVEYKRTFNLQDYNSITLAIRLNADLEAGEDEQACLALLWATAKEQVKQQAMPVLKPVAAQAEAARKFMGKPFDSTPTED